MKEITRRLQENRQIQLAKEILESNSYKVEKELDPEYQESAEEFFSHLSQAFEILKNTEEGVLEALVKDKLLYDRMQDYVYNLDAALLKGYVKESAEDLVSKVKLALDNADISYEVIGKNKDRLVVSKEDLKKASEIRDEIDPEYTVTVSSRA